jgi:recombination protein RecT
VSEPQNGNGLRDRVRSQRDKADQQAGNGGQVEKKHPMERVKELLDGMAPEIGRALPAHLNPDRMARIMYTQMRRIPKLAQCSSQSLAGAILTCAQMGMEPGPTGEAWILPYWDKKTKGYEAQFQLGYKGMAKLFWQHPLAQYLDAQTVYERDHFEYEYGLNPRLEHKPARGDRGAPTDWYAVAKLTNGGFRFIVLDRAGVERHRQRSQTPDSPAWKDDYNAMACKSCLKEMFALLPKSAEIARMVAQDGSTRIDLDSGLDDFEPEYPDAVPGDVVDDADAPVDGGDLPVEDPPGWDGGAGE